MKKLYTPRQFHLYAELYGVNYGLLNDRKLIKKILVNSIKQANLKLVKFTDYHHRVAQGRRSLHQGISAVAIIEESHAAIYTWPEHNYCALDILTCGKPNGPRKIKKIIEKVLKPKRVDAVYEKKGF
ncbi:adenosylmethionine decarboxylase [Patescibacteria group bacterium]|nr:adenosylmethionine decarboxylase [Patescibacteria group bacterium]MBU1922460.1 adenosylmethionine decarboxylase [Patescibacteria group bacterium]